MTGIDALLSQTGMLQLKQIEDKCWVAMDQGQKADPVKAKQSEGREGFCITAVDLD